MHCKKIIKKRIVLIVILSLFMIGFFTPFLRLATEGSTFPDDVARLKTSSNADFYAISESDLATRWILQGAEITPLENFTDDLNTDYWNLVDVSEDYFNAFMNESYLFDNSTFISCDYTTVHFDVGTEEHDPHDIVYDGTYLWVVGFGTDEVYRYTTAGVYTGVHFDVGTEDGLPLGITWDGTHFWVVGKTNLEVYQYTSVGVYTTVHFDISGETADPMGITWDGTNFWVSDAWTDEVYQYTDAGVYTTVHFDTSVEDNLPSGITWDGTYFWVVAYDNNEVYQYNATGDYTGIHFDVGTEDGNMMGITWDGTYFWTVGSGTNEVYQYVQYLNVSKNYFGSGYMYMETNTTEPIGLQSIDYTTHYNLSSGDYFEIDFQTISDSQINLILLKDGVVNETLILSSSGNTDFSRHTVQLSVDEYVEFDQLKINGTLENIDYVRIYDIKTYQYIITGDYADFYLGSRRTHIVNLTSDTYNLRIFEEGDEKVNENVTIGTSDYFYIYDTTGTFNSRLALFNTEDTHLEFTDYHIKVNRSLNNVYNEFWLLDSLFSVDKETYVYISVYDRLNTLIDTFEKISSNYIDLELEVYSLQIKSLLAESTPLLVNGTTFPLLSGDSLYFMLSEAYYEVNYTDEQGVDNSFTVYLDSNKAYQLNSSLKTIYFGLFTFDGLGIDNDLVRFYINGSRKDLGFNSMLDDSINVTVLDYFNNTLESVIIDTATYDNSEYNLYVEIYSMYILNRFTYNDLVFNITQVDSGYYMNQLIPSSSALFYRFIPNVNYTINATYINGTVYNLRTINLTENSQIESFGVPTTSSEYPKDVYFGIYTTTGLGVDRDLLRFYIDGDRFDFGFNRISSENVTLLVRDYFNSTLFNQEVNTSGIYEYNMLITLYSLKIKNEARDVTNYTLSLGALETTGYILPEEIIEYQLSSNNYVFDYTNNEDGSSDTININLNQDRVYILNSTYYDVYIGLYNFYGVVNREEVKFYINSTRADFGFNTIKSETVNLTVLDYFNSILFSQTVNLEGLTEYSIFVQAYTLIVNNLYNNQSITIRMTKGSITIERLIEPQGWTEFKLYPNITYNIVSYVNGTNDETNEVELIEDEVKKVKLESEYQTVSFGFFEIDMHEIPDPFEETDGFDILMFIILFLGIITPVIGALIYFKIRKGANRTTKAITNGKYKAFSLSKNSLKHNIRRIKNNRRFPMIIFILCILVVIVVVILFVLSVLRRLGIII